MCYLGPKLSYQLLLSNCYKLIKNCNKTRKFSRSHKLGQNASKCMKLNIGIQKFSGGDTPGPPFHRGEEGQSWGGEAAPGALGG